MIRNKFAFRRNPLLTLLAEFKDNLLLVCLLTNLLKKLALAGFEKHLNKFVYFLGSAE